MKRITPTIKRNIYRVIPFGVIWLVFSITYVLLEKGLLGNFTYYPSTGNPYSFTRSFFTTSITALIAGLLIGAMEIGWFSKLFIKKSFSKKIIYKSLLYLAIITAFLLITAVIANPLAQQGRFGDKQLWENVGAFFFNFSFLSVAIYMAAIIVVSQFYAEVSENIGQGALANFFMGKYHVPREEERIFMFLDMKSSTTIAEKLGHVKYFEMLKAYYADLSEPIIRYSGEIYQYAGDEIIVSWKGENGLANSNCIRCFFAMKVALQQQADTYRKQFDIVPVFKAGFHSGRVTTGEIGVIKKEIFFTGDVLNTAARIQGLCNSYQVDILVSGHLIKKLNATDQFQVKPLGQSELRGRDEKMELFTIEKQVPV